MPYLRGIDFAVLYQMVRPLDTLESKLSSALGPGFSVVREISGGGMSRVFLAHDHALDRDIVVKVLPQDLFAGVKVERFQRETQLVARLQHPHIVPILTAGAHEGLLYYTMPYVDGPSLAQRLKEQERMPLLVALKVLRDVADALSYAHAEGVVHRDVKPQNILLRGHHAFVVDFGVAKALSEALGNPVLTETGFALGTPTYIAPEQALADPEVDGRADIYSMGVVGYEMFAGSPPFHARSPQALLAAHVTTHPESLEVRAPHVPTQVANLIMQCLEKEPDRRFQTAESLRAALDSLIVRFTPGESNELPADRVSHDESAETSAPQLARAVAQGAAQFVARRIWLVGAIALVALGGAVAAKMRGTNAATPEIPVAVLPFENLDHTEASNYLADGVARELRANLSVINGLALASATSSSEIRRRESDVRSIARKLNVATVVEGTVSHQGDKFTVSVELTNGRTGLQMWSAEFSDAARNIRGVQGRMARAIGTALVGRLTPRPGHSLEDPPLVNSKAFDYFLQGQYLENKLDDDRLEKAITFYQLALSIDSTFAPAQAAIADAYYHLADDYLPPRKAYPLVRSAAEKAVALDSTLSLAHASLAAYELSYGWDWTRCRQHLDRALNLDPQSSFAHMLNGWLLLTTGSVEPAVAEAIKASSLDPYSDEVRGNVVSIFRAAGRHDLAAREVQQMREYDVGPEEQLLARLSRENMDLGNLPLAQAELDSALMLNPKCCLRTRAFLLARKGKFKEATRFVAQLESNRKSGYYRAEFLAEARAAIGDTTGAFAWLEQAYRDRSSGFPLFEHSEEIRAFKSDPRYALLARRLRPSTNAPN